MSRKLQFQREKSPSIGPKVAITSWYLLCVAGAVWLTFSAPMELKRPGSPDRQVALLACVVIYVARAAHTLFVFVKRKIPWWEAAWGGHIWKARPENRGHLYTEGLFRYSRHINYFGDLLLFGGCAALTRQLWTGIVPLAMGLNFAFLIIPAHDAYLAARYGSEFDHYASRTRKLVPLLY